MCPSIQVAWDLGGAARWEDDEGSSQEQGRGIPGCGGGEQNLFRRRGTWASPDGEPPWLRLGARPFHGSAQDLVGRGAPSPPMVVHSRHYGRQDTDADPASRTLSPGRERAWESDIWRNRVGDMVGIERQQEGSGRRTQR
jgi:hypothetical protein